MEQQEYDELVRRLVAVSEQHETTLGKLEAREAALQRLVTTMDARQDDLDARQTAFERLLAKVDARQDDLAARHQIHEDIMKSLAATLVKQDTINDRLTANMERLDRTNERLATSIERLEGILVGIRDILRRGNGRTEG
jgi:hypothetical protein